MARRKQTSPLEEMMDTLFQLFREAPAWLGPIVAGLFFALFRWFLPWMFSPDDPENVMEKTFSTVFGSLAFKGAPFVGGGVLVIWVFALIKKLSDGKRLDRQTGIDSIRDEGWQDFELLLSEFFRRRGYTVEQTSADGPDGGVDQRLFKDGEKTLVQCKHWKVERVGVKVVRELLGVMTSESAQHGIVVTSGSFTPDAREFAQKNRIRLISGRELEKLIRSVQKPGSRATQSPEQRRIDTSTATPSCPKCGGAMKRRTARRGPNTGSMFWGCSRYPKCRGTRND